MINPPLISVVMPAYNHERYIELAIQSILDQDYPELEIVVIDDGSSDKTVNAAERTLERGNRTFRLVRQDNVGAHIALNRGILMSYGEYIAILNSDDQFLPKRLSRMQNVLANENRRFAFSKVSHIDSKGFPHPYQVHYLRTMEEAKQFPNLDFELLRNNIAATTSNFFFHRSLYDQIGDFSPFMTCHDWDYILRVLLIEEPLFVNEILLEYRIHPQGTLQLNLNKVNDEVEQIMLSYLENVNNAKNPFSPGPLQWGDYWNFFSENYLDRIRVYPQVSSKLDGMRSKNVQINEGVKFHQLANSLEYQTHRLQKVEKDLLTSEEPLDSFVDLDLTQVTLHIDPVHKNITNRPHLLIILPWMVIGGAERFTLNLMDQLYKRGWHLSIVCTAPSNNPWKKEFSRITKDIFILPDFLPLKEYPRFLCSLIESNDFDALLLEGSIEGYRFLPTLHTLFPNLPILDYLHFVTPEWMDGGFPRLSYLYRDGIDLTIVSCQQVKNWMIEQGVKEDRLRICPIGVDSERWKPNEASRKQLRQNLGIREDEVVLIYAARLEAQKQPEVFAETIRLLSDRDISFRGLVAGDGSLRPELERRIQLYGLNDKVSVLGAVDSEEMPSILAAGDVFFLPSQNEGISSAVYEAMSCGLPVVGADVGGQGELVTPECGILLPGVTQDQQPAAYAEVLGELIEDKVRRLRMGVAGRERVNRGFTLFHMGECISNILLEVNQLKREGKLDKSSLPTKERFLRETQHVVEYLQARQEWRNLNIRYGNLSEINDNLSASYENLSARLENLSERYENLSHLYENLSYQYYQPRPPSYWFYLWIRQLFLPLFKRLERNPIIKLLINIKQRVKSFIVKT